MLLRVRDLSVSYDTPRGVISAVDRVSFDVAEGETLGLIGESGCGKSTLAKALMRLVEPSAGQIILAGTDILRQRGHALRAARPDMQMIFQDPYSSLNPRKTIGQIIETPLRIHARGSRAERKERVAWLIERVGLDPRVADRLPHEFSGGQRQRIGIARALALNPKIVVCDESVSALDVSVRAQILNLLNDLQAEFGLSYIFISHDLSVVQAVADRVAVMYLGRVAEIADSESIWREAFHPYSRALISAAPVADPKLARNRKRLPLVGDLPSPFNPPPGCAFSSRCPFADDECRRTAPALRDFGDGRAAACHYVEEIRDGRRQPRVGSRVAQPAELIVGA